ncbi:DUF3017 domain-containing protein [Streptomyces asoensis]|uniref:DUF3017 domain-containing protein n=1 Tax=Streptomyces asoensis TaxID=249586 RepID=UPI0033EDA9FD
MSTDSTSGRTGATAEPAGTHATAEPAGTKRSGGPGASAENTGPGAPSASAPPTAGTTTPAADVGDRTDRTDRTDRADGGDPVDVDDIEVRDPISAPDADGVPRRATRRFPLFTRDTARPEGGGRAAPGDALAARQWPIILVLGIVALGLLVTALDVFRIGTILIGVGLLVAAVLRWLLPGVGMLAVRSRFTDIVTYTVLGAAIVLLALMVQPDPWLQIPFLKDTLHFTVSS